MLIVKKRKMCKVCCVEHDISDFYTNGTRTKANGDITQRYHASCKCARSVRKKEDKKRYIDTAMAALGMELKCSKCGYNEYREALEFHHTEPSNKMFNIADAHKHSAASLLVEMAKCEILCCNCHQIHHLIS